MKNVKNRLKIKENEAEIKSDRKPQLTTNIFVRTLDPNAKAF